MSAPVYDASEWKPGDVAMVQSRNYPMSIREQPRILGISRRWYGAAGFLDEDDAAPLRRLVVIDYEDAEQVERLYDLVEAAQSYDVLPYSADTEALNGSLADALRAFANPPARIEEPQGLGVVVNDRDGDVWVKHSNGSWSCLMGPIGADIRTWDELCDQYGPISPGVVTP